MNCPKCGFENTPESIDCLRCGVIFAKIKEFAVSTADRSINQQEISDAGTKESFIGELVFSVPDNVNIITVWGKILLLLGLIVWSCLLVFSSISSNVAGESLLHLVNLPFHEAGHILFRPLGRFMTSLGGTLGQLIVPMACMSVLLFKTRDTFGAAVCLWWFGENFLDIAPYINDARAGVLPLVGGNFGHSSPYGFHDWEFLLTESGLLRFDHLLARCSHLFGSVLIVLAIAWAGYVLMLQYRVSKRLVD